MESDNCGFNLRSKMKGQIEIRNCAEGSWVIEAREVVGDRSTGLLRSIRQILLETLELPFS